jgi:hypothetical protein
MGFSKKSLESVRDLSWCPYCGDPYQVYHRCSLDVDSKVRQEWDEREHIRHQEREDTAAREQLDLMRAE